MKRIGAFLLSLSLLAGLGTTAAAANDDYRQEGEFWMYDALKREEIMNYGAGYDSTTWKVPYLDEKPVIDGLIGETEYQRFENFEEYLTLMAPMSGTTEDEFDDFRINADHFGGAGGFVTPYWGWDGEYLYMAFVVQNLSGFYCNPPSSLYLFTQNCLQIGIGDEFISGNQYTELGFGVNSETGELITHTWLGNYQTKAGTDYTGHYNEDTGIVTYEFRINLRETVGSTYPEGEVVSAGDIFKLAWILSVNGNGNRLGPNGEIVTGEEWQVGFCHGIGGPYSYKASEYFAAITLGAPGESTEETETEALTDAETAPESETQLETAPETVENSTPDTETETSSETLAETVGESDAVTASGETASETQSADKGGCSSMLTLSGGMLATATLAGAALLRKKKD